MTSKDFIKRVATNNKVSATSVTRYLDMIELELKSYLKDCPDADRVKVLDFTFECQDIGERKSRNPRTGEAVMAKPYRRLKIIPSADWKRVFHSSGDE